MSKIVIKSSKGKLLLGIALSLIFVVLSVSILNYVDQHNSRYSPMLSHVIGWIGILFFGGLGLFGLKKLFSKSKTLILDSLGIWDMTNINDFGLIKWSDIIDIKTSKIFHSKLLLIYVQNPDQYMNNANLMQRNLMEINNSIYGTPIILGSQSLQCSFDEFEHLIITEFNKYRSV